MSFNPFSVEGKRILVTGASSGIGRQVAITCAELGAALLLSGRNKERLQQTADTLIGSGHQIILADLTRPEERKNLVDACVSIDGMFFSAGIAALSPFRLISDQHLRDIFSIDIEAPILLTQQLLKQRKINPGASLVFNTAGAADSSPVATAAYSAAKAGLKAASRSLALEVAKFGIRVTCLQLGYVQTAMLTALQKNGMDSDALGRGIPLGMGTPEDAASAAIFLLSDLSRWISRTSLVVDGGASIRISH